MKAKITQTHLSALAGWWVDSFSGKHYVKYLTMFEKSVFCREIFIEKSDFLWYNMFEKSRR